MTDHAHRSAESCYEPFIEWLGKMRNKLEGMMSKTVTESIYSGTNVIVPLANVQHIEKWGKHTIPGIMVVTSHTKWNFERDVWENGIWISEPEATAFRAAWCRYRSELEADTLADLSPLLPGHEETMAGLGALKVRR